MVANSVYKFHLIPCGHTLNCSGSDKGFEAYSAAIQSRFSIVTPVDFVFNIDGAILWAGCNKLIQDACTICMLECLNGYD